MSVCIGRMPEAADEPGQAQRMLVAVVVAICLLAPPSGARAQISEPCESECALVLGASSLMFATGTLTAVGRAKGGYSTVPQAITAWSAGFVVAAGAGIALQGNGERQRRAVYASGIGALGAALAGFALDALVGESDSASRLAATLIGSSVGVVAGGAIGALGYDGDPDGGPSFTVVWPVLSFPLGR